MRNTPNLENKVFKVDSLHKKKSKDNQNVKSSPKEVKGKLKVSQLPLYAIVYSEYIYIYIYIQYIPLISVYDISSSYGRANNDLCINS